MVVQVKSLKALQVPSDLEKILYQICFFVIKFFNESTYLLLLLSLRERTLGHHMSFLSTTETVYPHRSSGGFVVGGFLCQRGGVGDPVRVSTSAPVGDLDPYPQVYRLSKFKLRSAQVI